MNDKVKTFSDMARYFKNLLPTELPINYAIKPMFLNIESEENIRDGVFALKDFMELFYDLLIEDGKKYEKPKSSKIKSGRNPSYAVDFPFIYHTRSVLLNIGYHGKLNDGILTFYGLKILSPIICCEGMQATTKMSNPKIINCLRFLNECGMIYEGFDIDAEKSIMADKRPIEVTYPDNPAMLIGLKIMSIAQRDLPWKTKDEIFLRCDYRALTHEKIETIKKPKLSVT